MVWCWFGSFCALFAYVFLPVLVLFPVRVLLCFPAPAVCCFEVGWWSSLPTWLLRVFRSSIFFPVMLAGRVGAVRLFACPLSRLARSVFCASCSEWVLFQAAWHQRLWPCVGISLYTLLDLQRWSVHIVHIVLHSNPLCLLPLIPPLSLVSSV